MSEPLPHPAAAPRLPSRSAALWFECRAMGLRALRLGRSLIDPAHRRHRVAEALRDAPLLAESIAPLWPTQDAPERALVLGKIQNLRVARVAFDGVELAPGEVLSFWAQLGRPVRRRGFAVGRELREGCLIPTVGGGLCQLSNALYDAALKGGMEILERHAHSQVVPGSAAVRDRDATVFWNYIDLRLRAPCALRIEVALDADSLRVRLRGHAQTQATLPVSLATRAQASADAHAHPRTDADAHTHAPRRGDCAICGETSCFRNAPTAEDAVAGTVAVLAGALSPEHAAFLAQTQPQAERLQPTRRRWPRLQRRVRNALQRLRGWPPARRALSAAAADARAAATQLRPTHLDVYVDQAWLPVLWRRGVLAGRRVHVLMRSLPMAQIHAELERAAAVHPQEPTLRDFRADPALLRAETEALAAAQRWIGAHAQAVALGGARAEPLPWRLPSPDSATDMPSTRAPGPLRVLFPTSTLVRKGALELSAALRGMDAEVLLPLREGGEPARWAETPLRRVAIDTPAQLAQALLHCDAVVLPAWVEHQPRALLAAIAQGVPVIATAACGLGALPGWREVPAGDAAALRIELTLVAQRLR